MYSYCTKTLEISQEFRGKKHAPLNKVFQFGYK
jgi:hypothetical protein